MSSALNIRLLVSKALLKLSRQLPRYCGPNRLRGKPASKKGEIKNGIK